METKNKNSFLTANDGSAAFLMMMSIYVLGSFLGQTIIYGITGGKTYLWTVAVSACFSSLSMFAVIFYFKRAKNYTLTQMSVKKSKGRAYLLALILSLAMFFGLGFINTAFSNLIESWGLKISSISFPLENGLHLILFSIVFAVIPAVIEELFFRGLMLNAKKGGKPIFVAVWIAVSFSLYHCSAAQFLYQLVYGIALCLLAYYADSILPCVFAHFLNNFAVIILTYFRVSVNLFNPYFIVGGLILLALFFVITLLSVIKKQGAVQEKNQNTSTLNIPLELFGWAICFILIIGNLFAV